MKTYYITKWWQAKGILAVRGEITQGDYFSSKQPADLVYVFAKIGIAAFATREEARLNVIKKATAKLAALEKEKVRVQEILDCHIVEAYDAVSK